MQTRQRSYFNWPEKIGIALGLFALSALLYGFTYLAFGDADGMIKYVARHVAFLPIHAWIIGVAIEEILSFRERQTRRKRLHMFLGTFFRQMGVDILTAMLELVVNRDQLDRIITVHPNWQRREFHKARQRLAGLELEMSPQAGRLVAVFELLAANEREIIEMTRNPSLWEFDSLYRSLMALFHLIEETRFRGRVESLPEGTRQHLAHDVGQALRLLLLLWLAYLQFLKGEHPVLFKFQMGVHNTVQPVGMEGDWQE